jgi:hypothetical protein
MQAFLQEASEEMIPLQLAENALGMRPLRILRQGLAGSGKAVYRVDLADGRSTALRISDRPNAFAFTRRNLDALRALGLPVQSVIAEGSTQADGSYIILSWVPGRDLVHELGGMNGQQMSCLAKEIVEYQRRVGGLRQAERFGWAPIGENGNLLCWSQVFGEAASASSADDGTVLGGFRSRLCALRGRVESYFDTVMPVPFLDDLTTKNVLIQDGALSGMIDVDFVCYGDPLLGVGATMACVAGDVPNAGAFYGEELIRCWNPNSQQRLAILFYAALWGIGLLQLADATTDPARVQSLRQAAESWLSAAEGQRQ